MSYFPGIYHGLCTAGFTRVLVVSEYTCICQQRIYCCYACKSGVIWDVFCNTKNTQKIHVSYFPEIYHGLCTACFTRVIVVSEYTCIRQQRICCCYACKTGVIWDVFCNTKNTQKIHVYLTSIFGVFSIHQKYTCNTRPPGDWERTSLLNSKNGV